MNLRSGLLIMVALLGGLWLDTKAQTDYHTVFERSNGQQTSTYEEGMLWWHGLAQASKKIQIQAMGPTDSGFPLHLIIWSKDGIHHPEQINDRLVVLINNAIHAGEPDGVEATKLVFRRLAKDKQWATNMEELVIIAIPFYSIGGVLNRNSTSRANQVGPNSYGFRGNAQNLDLNRDFIKQDSKNAASFSALFQQWEPDIFIDTHVSNGADYQYTLTCLVTQEQKLGGSLGTYLRSTMLPELFTQMESKGEAITPYVNAWGVPPDSGIVQFWDHPRYSTGYAALFNTIGFMTETHMLKPFSDRVKATTLFLETLIEYGANHKDEILKRRWEAKELTQSAQHFPIQWEVDKSQFTPFSFKGYKALQEVNAFTGNPLLTYDRTQPFEKEIPFYNHFVITKEKTVPQAYIIPQGWHKVIERLKREGVELEVLQQDSTLKVTVTSIEDFNTVTSPYEGHYLHYGTTIERSKQSRTFRKGDWVITMNQPQNRFLVEVLEPEAQDSFFNWNFFDTILQRKEGFSSYVFVEKAAVLLAENDLLRKEYEVFKESLPESERTNGRLLRFIYERSPHAEQAYRELPVYRIERP